MASKVQFFTRWTGRMKRHGGLYNLLAKRNDQIERLERLAMTSVDPMIKACFDFLRGHPLRVLGAQVQAHFGWDKKGEEHGSSEEQGA
jgi:hypothetical protein